MHKFSVGDRAIYCDKFAKDDPRNGEVVTVSECTNRFFDYPYYLITFDDGVKDLTPTLIPADIPDDFGPED